MAWKVMGTLSAVAAAAVAQRGAKGVWHAATGEAPPTDPNNPDVSAADAAAWALLSGGAVVLAQMWATRRAAQYYRNSSGTLPKQFIKKA